MPHLVLIGDSIFDNARYTSGQPDVISHARKLIPAGWRATLLAIDGATTNDIPSQLRRLPPDASHIVLSVGGNNAIMNADVLTMPVQLGREALAALAEISRRFEESYRQAVEACLESHLPLVLCTIYGGCFDDATYQRSIKGDVKNIFLPTPEARIYFATSSPSYHGRRSSGVLPWVVPSQ